MDYDFSGLCADQLEKFAKRLVSLNKAYFKEYALSVNVINDPGLNDHREQIFADINAVLLTQANRCEALYTEAMNRIQGIIKEVR